MIALHILLARAARIVVLLAFIQFAALPAMAQWAARHGLTGAQYQQAFNEFGGQGYRLVNVTGYESGGQARFAALWVKKSGPAWAARHGMTGAQYQQAFNEYGQQGYRLTYVNGYSVGNTAYYAAIWEKTSGPAWAARHGLTAAQYQAAVTELSGQGYGLSHVSAFSVGGSPRFAAIFVKNSPQWVARHGLTAAQYQAAFNQFSGQGFRLKAVSGYLDGTSERYAAVWTKAGGPQWAARHGIQNAHYQHVFDNYAYQSWEPVYIEAFNGAGGVKFNGVWTNSSFSSADLALIENKARAYMQKHNVPGLSLAISRNERLVYAAGFGQADQEKGEPVGPRHRFRIASVSKPITAVAIMKMIENRRIPLSLDTKVFGSGSVLGGQYSIPSGKKNMEDITVRHLLQHVSGFNTTGGDPMFDYTGTDHDGLIKWVIANRTLGANPGNQYAYSNFGYCLLGRIIEARSGKTYENYVRETVLVPAGANGMVIGGDKEADRKPNEVKYYGAGAYTSVKPQRFDSHGGWIATPIDLLRFMARVDGMNAKPDTITAASRTAMITPSGVLDANGANMNYGFGWGIGGGGYGHNGVMGGTAADLSRRNDGFSFAIVTNMRPPNDTWATELKAVAQEIINEVSAWPNVDLF